MRWLNPDSFSSSPLPWRWEFCQSYDLPLATAGIPNLGQKCIFICWKCILPNAYSSWLPLVIAYLSACCKQTRPQPFTKWIFDWNIYWWWQSSLTLLWDTLTWHSSGTLLLDTFVHCTMYNTQHSLTWLTWHLCSAPWLDTLPWHSCRALLLDTRIRPLITLTLLFCWFVVTGM